MDHAEAAEPEVNAPQNEIADESVLRGNSTEATADACGDDDVDGNDAHDDPAVDMKAGEEADESMEVDAGGAEGSDGDNMAVDEDGPTAVDAAPHQGDDTDNIRMSTASSAQTTTGGSGTSPAAAMDSSASGEEGGSLNGEPPAEPDGESSSHHDETFGGGDVNDIPLPGGAPKPTSSPMSEGEEQDQPQPAADPGVEMSVDGEGDDDRDAEDANSVDRASSSAHLSPNPSPPPQDQTPTATDNDDDDDDQSNNERSPLETVYGPFIHPTDTCIDDARERLRLAIEQTRLLREAFHEQAYDRFRCVTTPAPESLHDILEPIETDPDEVITRHSEKSQAIKAEKNMEKKQAQQAGVTLEELAYFGEGLHLVILPEDEVDENEIEISDFPERGPIDPETGKPREEISGSAATSAEVLFEKIRRIRAFRAGEEYVPKASSFRVDEEEATPTMARRSPDRESLNESVTPGSAVARPSSSPAPSGGSTSGDDDVIRPSKRPTKDELQHLLTLDPEAEGARPDGTFTAVQSALIARGVGMYETKRDYRINPLRQRMIQQKYFGQVPSYKLLPPLIAPHQLYRLQAADARKEGAEVRTGARESIKSVVEEICSTVDNGKLNESDKMTDGDSGGGSSNVRSTLEIGLLRRMRSAMLEHEKEKNDSAVGRAKMGDAEITEPNIVSLGDGEFDPLLAFSVMSAVGLVRKKQESKVDQESQPDGTPENAYAKALGINSLVGLDSISKFFQSNKRPLPDQPETNNDGNDAKKSKPDSNDTDIGNKTDDVAYGIRGGGRSDETTPIESNPTTKNGLSQLTNAAETPITNPSLAGYAGYDPSFNPMAQAPLGGKQSQSVIAAAAASRQLMQHQLGAAATDPYHAAAIAHQLNAVPIGSHLGSLPATGHSEIYSRHSLAGNPDWSTLNPAVRADVLAQHPPLTASLGLAPGQMSLTHPDQEAARMLLHDHQNAAAARAHEAVTATGGYGSAVAAHYQAAMSTINPQNPFGYVASSISQLHSNEKQPISSLPASHVNSQKGASNSKLNKDSNGLDAGDSDQVDDVKRSASAPLSPPNSEPDNVAPGGGLIAGDSVRRIMSQEMPALPEGLKQEIANLIANAQFHEAHSLSQMKSDESEALLIQYLLSLGAVVPVPKELISVPLVKKLSSSNYQLRLHEFVGSSSAATASRDVIIAIITIWLWAEHEDCFKQSIVENGKKEADPNCEWLIDLAIDKSLSALAIFFDSRPSGKSGGYSKETPNEKVASIASQSLAKQVFVDNQTDASVPILEDLHKLLDSLRRDSLQAKTQERVLLAALASRCGNMSEAFSNAYVGSIVRAGVALGHENVCELVQDEECRASTMVPYDFFHDNIGIWEEPCRPTTGYHLDVGGDELKKVAHARSAVQKSMKRLQHGLGLRGGIADGGPYFSTSSKNSAVSSALASAPPLVRTQSGSMRRMDSGAPIAGQPETLFNPDHNVVPMLWDSNDVSNLPYGQHQSQPESTTIPSTTNENKKRKLSQSKESPIEEAASLTVENRSTQEVEWEDVANMFFHGGSTRSIDINYDFASSDRLGKKKIFAPYVNSFERSTLETEPPADDESDSDEDISDEAVLQRHQGGLDEMKLKLDAALESRKQPSSSSQQQQRGRKK